MILGGRRGAVPRGIIGQSSTRPEETICEIGAVKHRDGGRWQVADAAQPVSDIVNRRHHVEQDTDTARSNLPSTVREAAKRGGRGSCEPTYFGVRRER